MIPSHRESVVCQINASQKVELKRFLDLMQNSFSCGYRAEKDDIKNVSNIALTLDTISLACQCRRQPQRRVHI